jgi:hypothetical protein
MTPTVEIERPLRYFIHNDWDALRMELSGRLLGKAAREAYESLRNASFLPRRLPVIIDISYVAEADAEGRAILRRWREQDGCILAATPASRAIAEPILSAPIARPLPRPGSLTHVSSLFSRVACLGAAFQSVTAGISADGERNNSP